MYPMNKKVNSRVVPVQIFDDPPDPYEDPVLPQTKRFRSKLIFDRTVATRREQIRYGEQKRRYEAALRAAEADTEMQQVEAAKEQAARDVIKRHRKVAELRNAYQQQFDEVARRRQEEHKEDLEYEAFLARQDAVKDREEVAKQAQLQVRAAERREEFRQRNDELLMRKANKIEEDLAAERVIQRQSAEQAIVRDEREKEDIRRRLEKTRMRERVGNQRAKDLAAQSQKIADEEEAAASSAAAATFAGVMKLKARQEEMAAERHGEWMTGQIEKASRKREGKKKPWPTRLTPFDVEEYNRTERRKENLALQGYLGNQIEERKGKERREVEQDRYLDSEMLAATQTKFNASLAKLQTLIPEHLGIEVPPYTVSRSITKFN
jgi:fused signal recognition particle receptor